MQYKDLWDIESAVQVLTHEGADSRLWAEAVEWLIIYGPPEIRRLLLEASGAAIQSAFPELKPHHYSMDGKPVYSVDDLAFSLGVTTEEARRVLREKNVQHGLDGFFDDEFATTVH